MWVFAMTNDLFHAGLQFFTLTIILANYYKTFYLGDFPA